MILIFFKYIYQPELQEETLSQNNKNKETERKQPGRKVLGNFLNFN